MAGERPIEVTIVTDVEDVITGAGRVADSQKEIRDALDDTAQASDAAGRALASSMDDGRAAAGRAADAQDDVKDALRDTARASERTGRDMAEDMRDAGRTIDRDLTRALEDVKDAGRDTGRSLGRDMKAGADDAKAGLGDFKDEANSTAKESAASFDGSAESILGSFQEVAANAFTGFGPAGAAAGLAAAIGIGIAVTAMQDGAQKATDMKQKAVDMLDAIDDAGGNLADLDLADTIKAWGREVLEDNWVTFWADESSTKFQETAKDAKTYGVAARDAIRAASGSADDSRKFLEATADDWQKLSHEIEENTITTDRGGESMLEAGKAAKAKRDALSDLRGQAEENIKTTEDAVEIYGLEKDAINDTEEAAKAAADAIREKADATRAAAGNAMDLTEAESNWVVTLGQMTKDIATNGRAMDVNTEAGRANRESLVDIAQAANTYRDAAIAAGDSTAEITSRAQAARDAFINQATAAGLSRDAAASLADSYGLIPGNVKTLVEASGTEEAKAAIESIPDAKDTAVTTTETGADQAQAKIDAVHGKETTVTTKEQGAQAAQSSIDAVRGKDVKIDVDDMYTVREVQKRIDGIEGKDVFVNVKIGNEWDFRRQLDALTAPRDMWVTVNQRGGVSTTN